MLWLNDLTASGEHWAVEAMDLNTASCMEINSGDSMQSASVIKLLSWEPSMNGLFTRQNAAKS
ncbi:MAG: hypothetical protein ACLR6B_01115 [Blautia sp.]